MYPAQNCLNQNKFAFLCWEEAEMKLAGSWCQQHHLYILKWITDKGFALLQEKGPNVFAFKYRIKWNAYSQCVTSFWLPVWRRRAEKSRPYPPKLSLPFFYLLLKQMRPIVGNFCVALNGSMVTLTEINAFNLPLWYIWDAIQQPVGSSWSYKLLHDEMRCGCLYIGVLCRALPVPRKEQGGPCLSRSLPPPPEMAISWQMWEMLKYGRRQAQKTCVYHLSKHSVLSSSKVFSSAKKSLPFRAKFPICGVR